MFHHLVHWLDRRNCFKYLQLLGMMVFQSLEIEMIKTSVRCVLRTSQLDSLFFLFDIFVTISLFCLYSYTSIICHFLRLDFLCVILFPYVLSSYDLFPSSTVSSPVLCSLFLSWDVWLGGVSSRQSYPSAQYESGLQQRGQQGEQPGHQPRTLLHTSRWVAVVARRLGGGGAGKIKMSKSADMTTS